MNDRFKDYDSEVRDLVLDFERTVMRGGMQFFDVDELEMIIDYYLEVNDIKPLEEAVRFAEKLYPDSTEVKLRRAHVAIARKQYKSALNQLLVLHDREPENTDLAYSLGIVYSAMGRPDEAVDQFLAASSDGWQLGRIYGNIAEEYVKKEDLDTALRYYEAALASEGHDSATLYNYVDTCEQKGCPEVAVQKLEDYVDHNPYSRDGWHCLGLVYIDLGLLEKAVEAFEYALAIDKGSGETYVELAYAYELLGDVGRAASTLVQYSAVADNPLDAYRRIGTLYLRAGNNETAVIYLRKALAIRPNDISSLAALVECYLNIGELPMAESTLRRAEAAEQNAIEMAALANEDEEQRDENRFAHTDLLAAAAKVHEFRGDIDGAVEHYQRMIAEDTCSEQHYMEYVDFLFRHRLLEDLITIAEDALVYLPQNAFYCTYLAAAYFYTNRYNSASRMLPHVAPEELARLCPEIMVHPLLGPLVPHAK